MSFSLFRERFPDLAARETSTFTRLAVDASGLPAGQYVFLEMFCYEPGCDCRRVLLAATNAADGRCEAVINFGWEDENFYKRWMGEDEPDLRAAIMGPCLHLGPAQGPHADALLDLAKQSLLRDPAYIARLREHYRLFREDVERSARRAPERSRTKVGRNDPCPCGSGRKFKKCCA